MFVLNDVCSSNLKLKFHLYELLIIGDYCFKGLSFIPSSNIFTHNKFVHVVDEFAWKTFVLNDGVLLLKC